MKKIVFILAIGSALLYGAVVNGWMDLPVIAMPAAPAAGAGRLFINSGTGKLDCVANGGASCMPASTTQSSSSGPQPCELVVGDPGAASPVLTSDNVELARCKNTSTAAYAITGVSCFTASDSNGSGGGSTVRVSVHGGSATSILSGDCVAGTVDNPSACSLSGAPSQAAGARLDFRLTTPNGTDKYGVCVVTRQ